MELVADRFVDLGANRVVDLATGERVRLERLPPVNRRGELAWAADAAKRLGSRDRLVDFGVLGGGRRFEAWAARPPVALETRHEQALAAIVDAIDRAPSHRPVSIALFCADPEAPAAVAIAAARYARGAGFVPFAAALFGSTAGPALFELVDGRSLFLIANGDAPVAGLLQAMVRCPRPHLLLCVTSQRIRGVDTIVLGAAAARARVSRAAEQPASYGSAAVRPQIGAPQLHQAASDLLAWRRRAVDAEEKLRARRHAAGERLLRQAVGALTRRHDWSAAADALNVLARALLNRGRPRDALAEIGRAREMLGRIGDGTRLIDTTLLAGGARLQLAEVDEAEETFAAAVTAATAAGDAARVARARAGLAHVLLWRGRYEDAGELAARIEGDRACPVRVVAAVGTGRLRDALTMAASALDGARQGGVPAAVARGAALAAFVHLAAGEIDAAIRELHEATRAALRAGDRLLLIRCRLLEAEASRRAGRREPAGSLAGRLSKIGSLPPILRAHSAMLAELVSGSGPAEAVAARHAKTTGLAALQLLVPVAERDARPAAVEAIVDVLQLCQAADDEHRVLHEVCRRTLSQLDASSVGVYASESADPLLVASDGGRPDPAIAGRAIAAGITIDPHQIEDRVEAAAPVRYGGSIIGAVAARWALGSPHSRPRAVCLLPAVAAAVAPVLAVARAKRAVPSSPDLIGVSAAARDLRAAIEQAASAPFPVLIEGESGSGKELVARALHRRGSRRDRPFCTLNCAALPDDLVESELFGHARGSFTGALGDRAGVFEEAHTGTLLLDEVSELSARAQAKLLRVVQEGELRRVGENIPRRVDVRLLAASNRDLRNEADAGRFRKDLLYRLDVVRIPVPPLRERREDIPLLVEHYWREATSRLGSRAVLGAATLAALARHDWPGNVRELQNVLASLAVRVARRGVVGPSALPPMFAAGPANTSCRLDEARRLFEEHFVRAALVRAGGRRVDAAAELGVTRQGLTKLMARLGIED